MLKQWILLLTFTGLALSSDLKDDSSTQLQFSSTTISPRIEITSQKPYQDVPSEEQVQQIASAAENSGTSSNANLFYSRLYHILSNNPDAISAITEPGAEKKIPVESHQHVTVHPPTTNRVSNIPVPVLTQPLRQYVQTVVKPTPNQYISAPVGYSQDYQNPNQELVTVHQPSGASVTSESQPRPISPSIRYHSKVLYVTPPTGAAKPPFFYPVAMKEVPVESQQYIFAHPPSAPPLSVASPVYFYPASSQTGHHYETVAIKPSSGGYLKYPATLSPSVQQIQTSVPPEHVQYILAPIKQVKTNVSKPINTANIEAHKYIITHPLSPTVAPIRNMQVLANSPAAPLIKHLVTLSSTPVINHHGIPQLNYASSPTVARTVLIPVMYNTESLSSPQYVEVNKPIESAQAVVSHHAPVSKPIPVPVVVYPNDEGHVRYNYKDRVVGYGLASNVLPQYGGYSKDVVFSPSSEVSSVRFSGNGFKYEY
ncbi:unnamed protein product [Arctia plantaginis]|uniref:Uncharacterized protein n=1 Tax=Arctia plantaginis TaxID=874455 RepID=A0A8S0Z4M5_ARCPL|nr:unnamed protein product [Arctia plantaginis]